MGLFDNARRGGYGFYVEDDFRQNPSIAFRLTSVDEPWFPFSDETVSRLRKDWPNILERIGRALGKTMNKRRGALKAKKLGLDIRTRPEEAIDYDEDMIACGGQGCVFHAMGHDSGHVVKITKSLPEVLAYRFSDSIPDLRQHPGAVLPLVIFERNYEDDPSIPEDEQRLFVIVRQGVTPAETVDPYENRDSSAFLEAFPNISQEDLNEIDSILRQIENASERLVSDVQYIVESDLLSQYNSAAALIKSSDQLEQRLAQIAAQKEEIWEAVAQLRSYPFAKRLADFIWLSLKYGLVLTDVKLLNIGIKDMAMMKQKPKVPQLALFDFHSILPEDQLQANPAPEPMLLPEWAI
jgi:hypothetical protein